MRKKILKIFLCIFVLSFSFYLPYKNIEAKTLREMKEDLADAIANQAANEAKRKAAQNRINSNNSQINNATQEIEQAEDDIEASREKISELEVEIQDKKKEIEELIRFLQLSDGDNVYLEYLFGASDFTDFIYRAAIVEELSNHNNNLIDEMYDLIEENKQLQVQLGVKIEELNKKISTLQSELASLDVTLDDIDEHQKDIAAEIKATKAEVQYYEDFGCKLDEEISDCINVPYATGFTKPTESGYISSNYGYRYIWGKISFHNGIDIALSEGNKVYASASGYVSKLVKKSSCGGNMIYINHTIGGTKYTSIYMHLLSQNVSVGDIVTLTTVIGYSGGGRTTQAYDNCTTGAHLHFAIYKGWTTSSSNSIDPRLFVNFPAKGSRYYSRW